MYISIDTEEYLLKAADSFQAVTLYGSIRVGKTTALDRLSCPGTADIFAVFKTKTGG